ncbi:hypothetical protein AB0G67_17250, partial [Streptomyces sp. NPDC021056]
MKASALGTAVIMGSVALTACGDSDAKDDRPAATASASGGAQEQGTAAVRSAYDKTAEAETAKMTVKVKASADGRSITSAGRGAIDLADGDSTMTVTAEGQTIEQRVVDQVLYQVDVTRCPRRGDSAKIGRGCRSGPTSVASW